MTGPTVFISYSHKDEDWKNRLLTQLKVLQYEDIIDLWEDRRIEAGKDWYEEIQEAINKANVAILLISADFLTSKFIRSEEVPKLLERREKEGIRIFPVVIKPCPWKQVKWLARMNLRPKDGRPISGGNEHQIDTDMMNIAEEVASIIQRCISKVVGDKGSTILGPDKISLAKLPSTNPELFGRENELKLLDAAWAKNQNTNIISLVAWGGIGKTALVNVWLGNMSRDNYRGTERVFGWSFYSQGASEGKQTSADLFIASALSWFGDTDPTKGSPWDKGVRLAEFIRKQRTLLILDGLEPLQNPPGEGQGQIKDPALKTLLRELANHNPGLCIITTRIGVDDIKERIGTSVQNILLEHLSDEAGSELLLHLGAKGKEDELKQAVREYEGHALALTLLGSYLKVVYKGDISQRDKISKLMNEPRQGKHAMRVMASYEKWFESRPELDILRIFGLFDRPAEGGAIDTLRAEPPIDGLTSKLEGLSKDNWHFALNNLREVKLIAKEDPHRPDTLDCHPLIREYFGQKLKEGNPATWKEAHSRLYEYYRSHAKEYPDTIEEMTPLYAAVAHGCQAGRYQDAMDEVYWRRILRGNELFNVKKLGAFGDDLATISVFFDSLWDKPMPGLTEAAKGYILNEAGFDLRALGRLKKAIQPMKTSLEIATLLNDWENAAIRASNLSELYIISGDLTQAMDYARQSVELADRSEDPFYRIVNLTTLADAFHSAGRLMECEATFHKAEGMQNKWLPKYGPYLCSLRGFKYCDMLLSYGKYQEVLIRAEQTIEIAIENQLLLDIGLDHLSLGRAHLFQALKEASQDFTQTAIHMSHAVDGLRQAGTQHHIPRSLLSRSELHIARRDFDKARRDLDEAMTIAERGEMGLHRADCHLGYSRLYLVMGDKRKAREHFAKAKEMIVKMGYHRRDGEVEEIEEQL
ncbi:MAG: TIR domain-containing protein [Proteobacteria bacterium]|nr:TIR domain-containing protein [Pseudomonadota bacterium]